MCQPGHTGKKADNEILIEVVNSSLDESKPVRLNKRYCWSRLSKPQFIIVITLVTIVSLFLIAMAVGYIFILPVLLPKIFWGFVFNGNWSGLVLRELNWVDADENGFYVKMLMTSKSMTLPVRFLSVDLDFHSAESGRSLFKISISDTMQLTGWDSTVFDFKRLGVLFSDPENTRDFLHSINDWYGTDRLNATAMPKIQKFSVTGKADVWVCGILIRNMDFKHEQELEYGKILGWGRKFTSPASLKALLDAKDFNAAIRAQREAIPRSLARRSLDSGENWSSSKMEPPVQFQKSKLELGPATVENLDLSIDSGGIKLKCDAKLDGKIQPYQAQFPRITASIHVDQRALAQFYINDLDLRLNDYDFKLDAGVVPIISETDISGVLESLGRVLSGDDVPVKAGINRIFLQLPSNITYDWMTLVVGEINLNLDLSSFQQTFMTIEDPSNVAFSILDYFKFIDLKIDLEENNTIRGVPNVTIFGSIDGKVRVAPFTFGILSETDRALANISVDAISFAGDLAQSLTPEITISLSDTVESANDVGLLLRKMIYNTKSLLGIGNIVFQGNAEEYAAMNRLFQIVRIQIPLQKLVWKDEDDTPSIIIEPAPGNAVGAQNIPAAPITKLDLSLIDGSLSMSDFSSVKADLKWVLASSLPFKVILPYVALRLGLNEIDAVKMSVEGLALEKGEHELNTTVDLLFGDDSSLSSLVVEAVDVFSGGVSTSLIVIQGLRIGPSEGSSYSLFDRIDLGIPIALLPSLFKGGGNEKTPNPLGGFFKLNLPPAFSSFSFASLEPLIRSIDLATVPNTSVQMITTLEFKNILPFSLDLPFLRATLLADKRATLVDITIQGLKAENGVNIRELSITGRFSNEPSAKVAFSNLIAGRSVDLSLASLEFGPSPRQTIDILSGLSLDIGGAGAGGIGNQLTSLAPWLKDISLSSFYPSLNTVDVSVENYGVRLGLNVGLTNPLPVTFKVGYLSSTASLGGSTLASIALSEFDIGGGWQGLVTDLDLTLVRDEALKDKVEDIVYKLLYGGSGAVIDIAGLMIGVSAEDRIEAFQSFSFPLSIPKLGGGSSEGPGIFDAISLASLFNLNLATTDVGLNFGLGGSLNNTSPFAVSVGYLAFDLKLANGGILAHLELSITTTRGLSNVALSVKSTVGRDRRLPPVVKSIYDDFVAKRRSSALSIDSIMIGSSQSTVFDHFSKVSFDFPIPFDKMGGDDSDFSIIFPSIKSLDLATSLSGFDSIVALEWPGFSFEVNVELGHLAADLFLDNSFLASASTSALELSGRGSQDLNIPVGISLESADSNAPAVIAAILNPILNEGSMPQVEARIGGIKFGANGQDPFDVLSLVEFSFDFNLTSPSSTSSSFKLDSLDLALVDEGIGAKVGASFSGFGIPITARLGHLSLAVDLFKRKLAYLSISNAILSFNEGNQDLILPMLARLVPEDPLLADEIATIANSLLAGKPSPVKSIEISFKDVLFGNSSANTFSLLEKVNANFIVSLTNIMGGGDVRSLFRLNALSVEPAMGGLKAVLTANFASLNLPILQFNIPYLSVSVILKYSGELFNIATLGSSDLLASGSGSNDIKIPVLIDFTTNDARAIEALKEISSTFLDVNPAYTIPLSKTSEIRIGQFYFGSNEDHRFSLFSKIFLGFNIADLFDGASSTLQSDLGLSLTKFDLAFNGKAGIDTNIGVKLAQALTIPISVSLPSFTADLYINQGRQRPRRKIGTVMIPSAVLEESGDISLVGEIQIIDSLSNERQMQDWFGCVTIKPTYPDACAKRFSIGNLLLQTGEESFLDLFSGITYVNYFYFDIGGLISGLAVPSRGVLPAVSFPTFSGDMHFVDTGVESVINLEVKTALPIHLDIGYMQIQLKDYSDDGLIRDLINLEVNGLRVGNGNAISLQVSLGATADAERWPSIVESFLFPGTMLPNTFAIVGLKLGKSKEAAISLLSNIPIPAIALQYLFPREGTDVPFSVAKLEFYLKPMGVWIPLISSFPLNIHCGTVFGAILDRDYKSKVVTSAAIYNKYNNTKIDVYGMSTSQIYVGFTSFDLLTLGFTLAAYMSGVKTVEGVVKTLDLGNFQVAGAQWIEDSLYEWRLPLSPFFSTNPGVGDGSEVERGDPGEGVAALLSRKSRERMPRYMRTELEAARI